MSERCTRIRLPGQKSVDGWVSRGTHTRARMIPLYRRLAEHEAERAIARRDLVRAAADEDFEVHVVDGVIVNRFVREASP